MALLESPYNFSGSQSWVRGFSLHGAKSKSSMMSAKQNAYELKLANFVDKNIANQ